MTNRTWDADDNYSVMTKHCDKEGIKYGSFINKAIKEKLQKLGISVK